MSVKLTQEKAEILQCLRRRESLGESFDLGGGCVYTSDVEGVTLI